MRRINNKTYLPELHLYGVFKLAQARLQMHGLTVGVVQVDGALLVLVLMNMTQVRAQLQKYV